MKKLLLNMLALTLTAPVLAQAPQGEIEKQERQQGFIFSDLSPAVGQSTRLSLPLAAGAKAATLQVVDAGGNAVSVTPTTSEGAAQYDVTFPTAGVYTLKVAGQPDARIRVGRGRLDQTTLHLTFDGPQPLADASGYGNNGKAVGELKFVDGVSGKGLSFANEASYVELPHTPSLDTPTQALTMSLWLKPENERNYSDFFTKGDWNVLKTDSRNTSISFFAGGWRRGEVEAMQPDDWEDGWHHLVGVVDGEEGWLYIDGELVSEGLLENELGWTPYAWNLGRNAEAPEGRGFNGVLDNVRIYPFALSEDEVEELYELEAREE